MLRIRLERLSLGLLVLHFAAACGGASGEAASEFADAGSSSADDASGGTAGRNAGGTPGIVIGSGGADDSGEAGTSSGIGGSTDGGASGDDTGEGGATDGAPPTATGGTATQTPLGACSNGLDDDDDGVSDGMDPECSGPTDNDEDTFATGIPGDNRDPKWQDCFFDGNSGAGDDDCRYHTDCLYGDASQDDANCQISDACYEYCQARTPNGCDCFGCCSVQDADGNVADIYITATCSTDNLDDEVACPRCTKSTACENTCGRCELCPGKTEADLPDDCGMSDPPPDDPPPDDPPPDDPPPDDPPPDDPPPDIDPPVYECENGRVCSDELPCPSNSYCQLGCCLVTIF